MDTLTHALSGALLARATEPKSPRAGQLPRRTRMWVGFWAAAFPDSDFVLRLIDPLTYLTAHRGITHSVIILPLWALVLAFFFVVLARGKYTWRAFAGVCALGIGVHIAGDVITAFGTMVFAPFSGLRVSLPTTFIIDPYFTAIIVMGLIVSVIWKQTRLPAVLGLGVLAVYVGFQGILHQRAVTAGEAYVQDRKLRNARVQAIPQPFSPFNWMVVVQQNDVYHMAYVNLRRRGIPDPPADDASWWRHIDASYLPVERAIWKRVPRFGDAAEVDLAKQAWHSKTLAAYRRFALFPAVYRINHDGEKRCVWFNDLRFALAGRPMPFRFGACRSDPGTPWRAYRLLGRDGKEIAQALPH